MLRWGSANCLGGSVSLGVVDAVVVFAGYIPIVGGGGGGWLPPFHMFSWVGLDDLLYKMRVYIIYINMYIFGMPSYNNEGIVTTGTHQYHMKIYFDDKSE